MKILAVSNIFPPHIRGGYELGALEILKILQTHSHKVVLATSANDLSTVKVSYDLKNLEGLDIRRIFLSLREYDVAYDRTMRLYPQYAHDKSHRFAGTVEANCLALKHLIEQEAPDLIYFFNPLGLGPVGLLQTALSFGGKRVVLHMMDNIDFYIRLHGEMIGTLPAWEELKRQLHTIACSRLIEQVNQEKGSFAQCRVIYNSLETTLWQRIIDQPSPPTSLAASSPPPALPLRLVYWGQLTARKGVLYLLDAVGEFKRRNPSRAITLDLYGSAEKNELAAIQNKISAAGIENEVKLKGFVDQAQLREKVKNYDVGVFLLDESEPFAYAPIESVLLGLYTVAPAKASTFEIFGESPLAVKNRADATEVAGVLKQIALTREASVPSAAGQLPAERRRMELLAREKLDLENSFLPALLAYLEGIPQNPTVPQMATETVLQHSRAARFPKNAPKISKLDYPRDLGYLISRLTKRLMFKPKLTGIILWVAEKLFGLKK